MLPAVHKVSEYWDAKQLEKEKIRLNRMRPSRSSQSFEEVDRGRESRFSPPVSPVIPSPIYHGTSRERGKSSEDLDVASIALQLSRKRIPDPAR